MRFAGSRGAAGRHLEPGGRAAHHRLVYSTDGGATWVDNPTVGLGATLLARAWYDNDDTLPMLAATLDTSLPAGFSLVPDSTRSCLAPDTSNPLSPTGELVCSTDGGQLGSTLDDGAIWSGQDLAVGPTAGYRPAPRVGTTEIRWQAIRGNLRVEQQSKIELLQLADVAAGCVWAALVPDRFGNVEGAYLLELAPRLYCPAGRETKLRAYGLNVVGDESCVEQYPWWEAIEAHL